MLQAGPRLLVLTRALVLVKWREKCVKMEVIQSGLLHNVLHCPLQWVCSCQEAFEQGRGRERQMLSRGRKGAVSRRMAAREGCVYFQLCKGSHLEQECLCHPLLLPSRSQFLAGHLQPRPLDLLPPPGLFSLRSQSSASRAEIVITMP